MPPSPTLPKGGEWATKPYSYIAPWGGTGSGMEWGAFAEMGGAFTLWHVGPHDEALRVAKKHGNRLKRLEASRAPVHQR
jgi:hypothetical protein